MCLVQNLASNANTGSATGSNTLSTQPVPRPNRHGMQLWRRHVEGIRLIESILHESTRKFIINMHRSQNAFQLDSGGTSKKLALEAIAKQFNDEFWTAPIRIRDDTTLSQTIKIDPNFHPKQVDSQLVGRQMQELRTIYQKAENAGKCSGTGDASIESYLDFCKDSRTGKPCIDVYYLRRVDDLGEFANTIHVLQEVMSEGLPQSASVGKRPSSLVHCG